MSASIFVFMGYTKIVFVSYTYSINTYWIPLLLVTGKHTVKHVYTFTVSGSARPIAAKRKFLFYSPRGKNCLHLHCWLLTFYWSGVFRVWSKCPKIVASDFGRCAAINPAVRPGHVAKCPLFTSFIKVYSTGLKHVECEKLAKYAWVFFFVSIYH